MLDFELLDRLQDGVVIHYRLAYAIALSSSPCRRQGQQLKVSGVISA